jgi:hypothetical protein
VWHDPTQDRAWRGKPGIVSEPLKNEYLPSQESRLLVQT